jgi:Uma2 family endonuclease
MLTQTATSQVGTLITADELQTLGDIGPCELIEGRLVKMSPTGVEHGIYESNFAVQINIFATQHNLGKVMTGEVGLYIARTPDTVRAADVLFISNETSSKRQKKAGYLDVAPELIVEILPPDDRWSDVIQKLRDYFSIGVKLVWVANPADKTVYSYRSTTDVREFGEADALIGDDVLPGFSVPVASLFRD